MQKISKLFTCNVILWGLVGISGLLIFVNAYLSATTLRLNDYYTSEGSTANFSTGPIIVATNATFYRCLAFSYLYYHVNPDVESFLNLDVQITYSMGSSDVHRVDLLETSDLYFLTYNIPIHSMDNTVANITFVATKGGSQRYYYSWYIHLDKVEILQTPCISKIIFERVII